MPAQSALPVCGLRRLVECWYLYQWYKPDQDTVVVDLLHRWDSLFLVFAHPFRMSFGQLGFTMHACHRHTQPLLHRILTAAEFYLKGGCWALLALGRLPDEPDCMHAPTPPLTHHHVSTINRMRRLMQLVTLGQRTRASDAGMRACVAT